MRLSARFVLITGAVLVLVISAWSGAQAAKGFNNPFSGGFLNELLSEDTSTSTLTSGGSPAVTETPIAGTPESCADDQGEDQQSGTLGAGGTPQSCADDQGEDQQIATPGVTGTTQVGEDDQGENEQDSTPVSIGTIGSREDDQGNDNGQSSAPSVVGSPQPHSGGSEGGSGGDDNGGD